MIEMKNFHHFAIYVLEIKYWIARLNLWLQEVEKLSIEEGGLDEQMRLECDFTSLGLILFSLR